MNDIIKQLQVNIYALPGIFRNDVENHSMQYARDYHRDFAESLRSHKVGKVEVFPYSHDSDKQYPWRPYTRAWEFDPEWFRIYKAFCRQYKKEGVVIDPIIWSKYQWRMYNQAGMHELSPAAQNYLNPYAKRLGRIHKRIFPVARRGMRLSNEWAHAGDHTRGIEMAHWHEDMSDRLSRYFKLKNTRCDVSHSDFCKPEECHVQVANRTTNEHKLMSYSTYLGLPAGDWIILREWGKARYDRTVWIEWHGATQYKMLGPVEPGASKSHIQMMHQGSWWNFSWNLDGSVTFKSGNTVPGTPWTIPTHQEIYDWALLGLEQNCGGVRCLLGYFPMEIFWRNAEGQLVENLDLFDYKYLNEINQAYDNWSIK